MTSGKKVTGKAVPFPLGVITGVSVSAIVTLIMCAALTWFVLNGAIKEITVGYVSLVILILAAMLGAITATGRIKRRRMLASLATGISFLLVLLLTTAVFFGGQYQGVIASSIAVLAGSVGAGAMGNRKGNGYKKTRLRIKTC